MAIVPERVFTLEWRIENFSYFSKMKTIAIHSPLIKALTLDESIWYLIMKRESHESKDYVSLRLEFEKKLDVHSKLSLDCVYSFMDVHGAPIFTEKAKNLDYGKKVGFDLPRGPTLEDVWARESEYLPRDTLTLRLHFWPSRGKLADQDEHCSARSVFALDRITTLWTIEKFSSLELNEKVTNSCSFGDSTFTLLGSTLKDSSASMVLVTNPTGLFTRYDGPDLLATKKCVSCKVSIMGVENETVESFESDRELHKKNFSKPWFVKIPFSREELLTKRFQGSKKDSLSLMLEFAAYVGERFIDAETIYFRPSDLMVKSVPKGDDEPQSASKSIPSEESSDPVSDSDASVKQTNESKKILLRDLMSLFKDCTLTDFELRSGDASFPVHKNILSARSPVFKEMFSSGNLDSNITSQEVKDVDPETLKLMLTFLYTGKIEKHLQGEGAFKLFQAAGAYGVPSLKRECSTRLRSSIDTSNVCQILPLADRQNDLELTSFVDDFLSEHVNEVITSKEWMEFKKNYPKLSGDTMHVLLNRMAAEK